MDQIKKMTRSSSGNIIDSVHRVAGEKLFDAAYSPFPWNVIFSSSSNHSILYAVMVAFNIPLVCKVFSEVKDILQKR